MWQLSPSKLTETLLYIGLRHFLVHLWLYCGRWIRDGEFSDFSREIFLHFSSIEFTGSMISRVKALKDTSISSAKQIAAPCSLPRPCIKSTEEKLPRESLYSSLRTAQTPSFWARSALVSRFPDSSLTNKPTVYFWPMTFNPAHPQSFMLVLRRTSGQLGNLKAFQSTLPSRLNQSHSEFTFTPLRSLDIREVQISFCWRWLVLRGLISLFYRWFLSL